MGYNPEYVRVCVFMCDRGYDNGVFPSLSASPLGKCEVFRSGPLEIET